MKMGSDPVDPSHWLRACLCVYFSLLQFANICAATSMEREYCTKYGRQFFFSLERRSSNNKRCIGPGKVETWYVNIRSNEHLLSVRLTTANNTRINMVRLHRNFMRLHKTFGIFYRRQSSTVNGVLNYYETILVKPQCADSDHRIRVSNKLAQNC